MNQDTFLYHRNFAKDGDYAYPIPNEVTPGRKPQIDWPGNSSQKKIGVTPGAIVGAIVGAGMAKHKVEKELKENQMRENAFKARHTPTIEGNYYSQAQNVMKNLEVVFTPVSAIYILNNKDNKFTLDTIEVSEMTSDMQNAWKNKNADYFKHLLLTKMFSEMQLAEIGFTKNFIKKQLAVKDQITKNASDTSWLDDIECIDLFERTKIASNFLANSEFGEKIAGAIVNDMEDEDPVQYIDLELDRPLSKYAGVITGIKDSLGLHSDNVSIGKIKKDLENPKLVMSKIKIGFLPERVVFSLNNQLVSTLPLTSMNEEGYVRFQNQDTKYFKNVFVDSVKESLKIQKESKASDDITIEYIEKRASEESELNILNPSDCLLDSNTHPVIIYLFLTVKLGLGWLNYDISIIERIIKAECNLEEIPEATLNKVYTILMANQSDNVYRLPYGFEKAVLSLTSKPVEFLEDQKESIKIQDIAYAIDVLDRVTPYDDIYDNFSDAVLNYICDVLSDQDMYVYNPTSIIGSEKEPIFNSLVNEKLLKAIKGKMTLSSNNKQIDEQVYDNCDFVADNALLILNSIRRHIKDNPDIDISTFQDGTLIDTVMAKRKIIDNPLSNLVKKQVIRNLTLDTVLDIYDNGLQNQLQKFNISMPEGEI